MRKLKSVHLFVQMDKICHHMIAFSYHAMKGVLATDVKCKLSKPKERKEGEVKTIGQLHSEAQQHQVFVERVTEQDLSNRVKRMSDVSPNCDLERISQPEPMEDTEVLCANLFQEIITGESFLSCDDPAAYLMSTLKMTKSDIENIERNTREQWEADLWYRCREGRITGSLVGKVLHHCKRGKFPPSLFKTLFGDYYANRSRSVAYGVANEANAIAAYESSAEVTVSKCGFLLHESGIIGSSPDGLVGDFIVCEFKCPSFAKNGILKTLESGSSFYLKMNNSKVEFNFDARYAKDRQVAWEYFHQCQCHMLVTGRKVCHFFVWSPSDFALVEVPWDPSWMSNVDILLRFYRNQYVPMYLKSLKNCEK